MAIEWSDKFSVGDEEIDLQHQTLFRVVNVFLTSYDERNLTEFSKEMSRYVQEHFTLEEKHIRSIGYPDYIKHLKQHDALLIGLNRIHKSMIFGTFDLEKSKKFFYDWVHYHIMIEDVNLLKFTKP